MKSLQTIQKTFRVFQILTRVALVFSIVGACFCAVGSLCAAVWHTGGRVFSLFGEPIPLPAGREDMNRMIAVLLADGVCLTTDAILLAFAGRYFAMEQAEGSPFTQSGADAVRRLGVRCIWMPIVSAVIASVILACLGAEKGGHAGSFPGIATGIVLILASLIFRYGAELEEKAGSRADLTSGS